MERPIALVDHPLFAESLSHFLQHHLAGEVVTLPLGQAANAPSNALALVELFLPEQQCGLAVVHSLLRQRPDVAPILWNTDPAPPYLSAALQLKLPGFLDKAWPCSEILAWIQHAMEMGPSWPPLLIKRAWAWDQQVAERLQVLEDDHWTLWLGLLRAEPTPHLAQQLGCSSRTTERRLGELFEEVGVSSRQEAISAAWRWGLVGVEEAEVEWSDVTRMLFLVPTSDAGAVE